MFCCWSMMMMMIDYDGADEMKLPRILTATSTTNKRRPTGRRTTTTAALKTHESCPRARDCTSTQHDIDTDRHGT